MTVAGGETVDMGILPLTGWFTKFDGYIFNDLNRNGKRDAGEPGVPNFGLTLRKRENSLMDRGATAVSTDQSGYYLMENAYPLTEWLVLEAYDDRYYTTGVTYQADNQPTPTTIIGQGVDVSVLPIIGLSGTLDWGVHAYDATGDERRRPAERRHRRLDQLRHHPQRARSAVRGRRGLAAGRLRHHRRAVRDRPLRHARRQRRATRAATTNWPPTASYAYGQAAQHLRVRDMAASGQTASRADVDGAPLDQPRRPAGPPQSALAKAAWKAR